MKIRPDIPPGQLRLLVTLLALTQVRGYPPTYRELCAACGYRPHSQNAAYQHARALERKGLVAVDGTARGVRPLVRLELWEGEV